MELVLLEYDDPDPIYRILMGYRYAGVRHEEGESQVCPIPLQTCCARDRLSDGRFTYTIKLFREEPWLLGRLLGKPPTFYVSLKMVQHYEGSPSKSKHHFWSQDQGRTWSSLKRVPDGAAQIGRLDVETEPLEMTMDEFIARHG